MTTSRTAGVWMVALVSALAAPAPAPAQPGMPPAAVTVDRVERRPVREHRRVTGELRAVRRSQVATQEPGLVIALPVREGDPVKAGDLLAKLDGKRLAVQVRQIEADEQALGALVEERRATLERSRRDLELLKQSFERAAANRREMLDAETAVKTDEARTVQAERQKEVVAARADLLRERLEDMNILAPYDGVVVRKHAELGEWVGEGDPVVEIVSRGGIEAWLEVPQRYFDAVTRSAPVIAISLPGAQVTEVDQVRVIPLVDPAARSFYVVAVLDDAGGTLTPGMSVTAMIPTGETVEQLTVPKDAILRNNAGAYVYAARESEPGAPASAQPVRIQPLFAVGDRMVVEADGLRDGDLVVVEGNERLFPMMPVAPQPRRETGGGS